MVAIGVVFGHSVVIPKKEKWPADIGTLTRDPRIACPNSNHYYTTLQMQNWRYNAKLYEND